jgi:orotate phosphoribosyltransferase-like protein
MTWTAISPQRELKETANSTDELGDALRTSNEVMLEKLKNSLEEDARQDVHDLSIDFNTIDNSSVLRKRHNRD